MSFKNLSLRVSVCCSISGCWEGWGQQQTKFSVQVFSLCPFALNSFLRIFHITYITCDYLGNWIWWMEFRIVWLFFWFCWKSWNMKHERYQCLFGLIRLLNTLGCSRVIIICTSKPCIKGFNMQTTITVNLDSYTNFSFSG